MMSEDVGTSSLAAAMEGEVEVAFSRKRKFRLGETIIQSLLFLCGAISVFVTFGIVLVLGEEAWLFFFPDKSHLRLTASPITAPSNAEAEGQLTLLLDAHFASRVHHGDTLVYELHYRNQSHQDANGVLLKVRLPKHTTYLPERSDPHWNINLERTLATSMIGSLKAEEHGKIPIAVLVTSDANEVRKGEELQASISIQGSTADGKSFEKSGFAITEIGIPSVWEFFTTTTWQPHLVQFGILPLLNSTLITTGIAMLVALPLGLSAAIYLSEYANKRSRAIIKPILEILAGIPTVVYGYFAITFMTPLLRAIFGADVVQIYNTASAGLVMGIMILPLVSSMSEDALSAVPRSLREGSYALGATRLETAIRVVVPAALSGILAAFIVSVSRAIGETMIVAIAAGAKPAFTFNPFEAAETMTGHIARISGGDLSYNSIDYNSIFAIGMTLFVMTLVLNIISGYIVRRFREVYE